MKKLAMVLVALLMVAQVAQAEIVIDKTGSEPAPVVATDVAVTFLGVSQKSTGIKIVYQPFGADAEAARVDVGDEITISISTEISAAIIELFETSAVVQLMVAFTSYDGNTVVFDEAGFVAALAQAENG